SESIEMRPRRRTTDQHEQLPLPHAISAKSRHRIKPAPSMPPKPISPAAPSPPCGYVNLTFNEPRSQDAAAATARQGTDVPRRTHRGAYDHRGSGTEHQAVC